MARASLDYDIIDGPSEEPIVFTGPPARLTARVPLRNDGKGSAVLRSASVRGGELASPATAAIRTTVLRPNGSARVRARLALAANTPPGDYPCEVEIGGSLRPAVLRVVETTHVVVSPSTLLIENNPGEKITKRILVHNRGNVTVRMGHPGGIALDDERAECRVTRATYDVLGRELEARTAAADERGADDDDAAEAPDAALTIERALGEWVKQGKQHLASVGPLGVRNAGGVTAIEGGEEVAVDLVFRVPAGLDQHTRYIGVYPFYDTDLAFVIVPGPRSGENNKEDLR
jgi:hypothetical protein